MKKIAALMAMLLLTMCFAHAAAEGYVKVNGRQMTMEEAWGHVNWLRREGRSREAMAVIYDMAYAGDPTAMYERGMDNVDEERLYWLEYAAMAGSCGAMRALYEEYQFNNKEMALIYLQQAAEAGDAQSMFDLATVYMWGDLEQQPDNRKARKWLDMAVEARWEPAWYHIAYAYEHGLYGYEQNDEKAVGWYIFLWDLGEGVEMWEYGEGVFNLACLVEQGRGTEKDDAFAYELFALAHEHLWDCKALLKMTLMQAQGRGTEQDVRRAWKTLDALREDAPGLEGDWAYVMSMMYRHGYGVEKSRTLADAYLEQAKEYGCMLTW